ncbi:type IV pilus assembly protein PilM [Mariniblastus fucicola]|uniref:Competence protein A n=1 Tax=Mariniblastus fucicola TaxID=980251 RepID=A0A5B9P6Y9_9BACT|nr:type IV pilus assembly protein PilM [Mariniblastus fucicola]QEG21309.1 Competence protein A [Mariniblastus fucicola]
MAKANAVWGIDIGQSSLKALRCVKGPDDTIVAEGYDFIEYPKILSAADADPVEIVRDSLEQFLSRNEVVGDKVAISVPGQAGLSRFFKPPPVDARKLPNLVEFEVSQQIPFPIEDVIWDWQQLGGSKDEEGRVADAEIGLFAMKRDAVFRALQPFDDAGVEVDIVQLSPLSIFNVVCRDQIDEIPSPEDFDPEDPPESIVVLSMGTDTTDLIVTNGIKLWLRNIPIGGNHFTKQLSREMKLTQAKAEHLKRNAKMAENPKAVFQAMRPVFNDLVNEVQRSLTFFQSMDKSANISEVVLLGSAAKLPGLTQFLGKQLELKVSRANEFKHLTGNDVTSQSTFANNSLSFAPCYGLCLQGLGNSVMKTNLLPQEIVLERVVRAKKPWVLAAVSLLLLGCCLGLFYKTLAANQVSPSFEDPNGTSWQTALRDAEKESKLSKKYVAADTEQKELLEKFNVIAKELSSSVEGRASWIEIYSALYQALPRDEKIEELVKSEPADALAVDPKEYEFAGREEIYIDHIETVFQKDLGKWYDRIAKIFEKQGARTTDSFGAAAPPVEDEFGSDAPASPSFGEEAEPTGLTGKAGWVIEIQAHHFHNEDAMNSEIDYVRNTILKNLLTGTVKLPDGEFTYGDLGISFPTITRVSPSSTEHFIFLQEGGKSGPGMGGMGGPGGIGGGGIGGGGRGGRGGAGGMGAGGMGAGGMGAGGMGAGGMGAGGMGAGGMGMGGGGPGSTVDPSDGESIFKANIYSFVIQMAWEPRSVAERNEAKKLRLEAVAAAAAAEAEAEEVEAQ